MESNLPSGVKIHFENPDSLHLFKILISPEEGYWSNGCFCFNVEVPDEYNIAVSNPYCASHSLLIFKKNFL